MFGLLFTVPMWLKLIFFLIGNGPTLIALIRELRALMKDLNATEQKSLIEMSRTDFEEFKVTKDKVKLMSSLEEKKVKVKTMQGKGGKRRG